MYFPRFADEPPWHKVNPWRKREFICITIVTILKNQAGNQLISCLIYLFLKLILREWKFGSFLIAAIYSYTMGAKRNAAGAILQQSRTGPAAYFIRIHPTADPEDPCGPDPAGGCKSCW